MTLTREPSAVAPDTADARFVCEGIKAGYGQVNVVRRFDLSAASGTVVAVLGPNGAGKTTLLSTLAGLLPAQAGTVSIDGEVLKNGRPGVAARRGLVLVPDDRSLFTGLTVDENLKAARGRHQTTVEQAYDRFPALAQRRKLAAGSLSGGEQQMLAVARALMQEPRVLLVDEMSMGLAPVIVEELMPMVRRVADETGAVVVLVEQHVHLALQVADRALVLVHGEIVLDRPSSELAKQPQLLEAAYLGGDPEADAPGRDRHPEVTVSRYAALSQDQLAQLVPELLLMGQLIDRSGMGWCISAFGREEMAQIAVEEWVGASPVYTRRMQRALGYEPAVEGEGDVVTIVKGLQLDIGAPPQFMDFRYTIRDPWHAEFQLDHCGALLDVEPMGDDYVRSMCHDIEDPTFDATAVASNPRAQMRPLHRPPRAPADRHPHCSWTIVIDQSHPVVQAEPAYYEIMKTRAAALELAPIDTDDEGASDYAGQLLSDIDFTAFSHSALVRIADEVALQMHLLNLSFGLAVRSRATSDDQAIEICLKQLTGIAGIGAERLHKLLGLDHDVAAALRVLELHPLLNPAAYVSAGIVDGVLSVEPGPAHEDGSWISLCGPGRTAALEAVAWAISPELGVEVTGDADRWQLRFVRRAEPAPEPPEVAVTRFSKGAAFEFKPRRSLPLFPV